jgi:uncharacterized membrane protein YkvA (DUF1232 family)
MSIRPTSWLSRPALLARVFARVRLASRLLREPRVPVLTKLVPLFAAVYVLSPIDVLPDFIPLIGQVDDVTVVLMAVELFARLCPAPARAFHEQAIAGRRAYSAMPASDDFIDTRWRSDPA